MLPGRAADTDRPSRKVRSDAHKNANTKISNPPKTDLFGKSCRMICQSDPLLLSLGRITPHFLTIQTTTMNQQATLHRWDDMPLEKVKDGLDRRVITGERMMITHVYLEKDCEVPWHAHDNEQLTYVLRGALQFWLGPDGEQEVIVHEGEVLVIPSRLPHKAVALKDTLDVDIFCPPRQDWLDGTDAYLR